MMKKLLLLSLALGFGLMGFAQTAPLKENIKTMKVDKEKKISPKEKLPEKHEGMTGSKIVPPKAPPAGTDVVSITKLGSAANDYTYVSNNGNSASTILWYDPNVNTVVHTHRMGGPVGPPDQYSGDLAYDISTDGGATWTNQVKVYESNISGGEYNLDAARYPQGAIYNPQGNTDPANAWVSYFAPAPDGSNGDWGGYVYGVGSIADPEDTTKTYRSANLDAGFYQGIPTAYTVNRSGYSWLADASLVDSYTEYLDEIIFMQGEFNSDINDLEYEEFLVSAEADYARMLKIAFGPDGQTGYVYWNDYNGSFPYLDDMEWSYPLLLKTDDGGETWSDELTSVEIGGPDGIDAVKNYLTDEQIIELFGELVDRDDILYTTPGTNSDIAVDAWGNPHIATVVHLCSDDAGFFVVNAETMGVFDLYTTNGDDQTWYGAHLGTLKNFDKEFDTDFQEYNRLQVASTWDGTKMFFTWNDTRLDGVEDNGSPDIYARGFDLLTNSLTEGDDVAGATNVTAFSEAMWQAYLHVTAPYVKENEGTYTIPMTYADMDESLDVLLPVEFKYIQDFSFDEADFTLPAGNPGFPVSIGENKPNKSVLSLGQNHPNPASKMTEIPFTLSEPCLVSIAITSITGQTVYEDVTEFMGKGKNKLSLNVNNLKPGIYFYTLYAGSSKVTKKMIIR